MSRTRSLSQPVWRVGEIVAGATEPAFAAPLRRLVRAEEAQRLLDHAGRIGVGRMSAAELVAISGISERSAAIVVAARELAEASRDPAGAVAGCPSDVLRVLPPGFARAEVEFLLAVGLTSQNGVKAVVCLSQGGSVGMAVAMRDVFRPLVRLGASAFVLAHNHPGGSPEPSDADVTFTRGVARAGHLLGIELLDHLVIATGGVTSFCDSGLMPTGKELRE